jgi:ADP-dependent NAD(P)H-hydrate dehydratase / NAD(P)H-hydrate epimerase
VSAPSKVAGGAQAGSSVRPGTGGAQTGGASAPAATGQAIRSQTSAAASVVSRETMRELDTRTIAAGTPSLELMERAGRALAEALQDETFHGVKLRKRPRLLVLAGLGNNGGDGFVVARLLAEQRWRCTVAILGDEPRPDSDAAANLEEWRRLDGRIVGEAEAAVLLADGADDFDIVLDAIFGTGLERPVEGSAAKLIGQLNQTGLPVVAADISSGLSADAGTPLGIAVRCRATLTIGAAKPGLFLAEGPEYSGRVRVCDIGLLDPPAAGLQRTAIVLDASSTASSWPRLARLAHKGSRGHVLVVAGSRGKAGAAILAARGALRAGAGLVTVATVRDVQTALAVALPEAMSIHLPSEKRGVVSTGAVSQLEAVAAVCDAVVIGPGLGTGPGPDAVVTAMIASGKPLVIDADGLNVVAAWDEAKRRSVFADRASSGAPAPILTPHPGEMGRLVKLAGPRIQLSRMVFAVNLAKELGAVVVLKGAATVVANGRSAGEAGARLGGVAFNTSGNPGMACAGMGDVLAGICGALAIRLTDPFEAACLAVWCHGAAGDELERRQPAGFLASELADAMPAMLATRQPR